MSIVSEKNEQPCTIAGVIVRCHYCGNEQETELQGDEPIGTKVIVTNFCPKCEKQHEGGFYEEMWCEDGKGNVL